MRELERRTGVGTRVTVHAFCQYTRKRVCWAAKRADAACWPHYARLCVSVSACVLRVKRPEIMRERGHFHSCKSTLNTSLPLEQLPYPKQLYGWAGSAQVNSDAGQLPGTGLTELWTPAECPLRAGTGLDLQEQSLIPHLGSNYLVYELVWPQIRWCDIIDGLERTSKKTTDSV